MDPAVEVKDDAADISSLSSFKLYETQFFGFTPQTLMLRVYSAFQDCLCDILPVLETVCVRELRKGESDGEAALLQSRARECSRKLQVFLEERFKKMWEHMEDFLSDKCFSVPTNVLLPEDKSHSSYPQDMKEILRRESSISDLQRSYEAEVCAKRALLAELEEQAEVQRQLDGILTWVRELQAVWEKEGNSSFHKSFQFLMESVKKLQEAIKEVYSKAPQ